MIQISKNVKTIEIILVICEELCLACTKCSYKVTNDDIAALGELDQLVELLQ
jgi:hypothetical protein